MGRKVTNLKHCHIKTCSNINVCTIDLNIMYHKFPLKYLRYHQWVQAIPTHLLDLPLREHTYICSTHFSLKAYKPVTYKKLGIFILRTNAYPTIFDNNDNKGNETTEDNNDNKGNETTEDNNDNKGNETTEDNNDNKGNETTEDNNDNKGNETTEDNNDNKGNETMEDNNDNKGNETTEDIEKSPQQEIKETLSQTGDISVEISAENIEEYIEENIEEYIEELEEENLPTEYVQKCLHPRDQTTQTNMLQPYDLDDYDIIFEKDEIQSDEESDNNLHEVIITTNIVQPITELGNNLFEVTMSSKNTKLVRNEIHPDKESESPVLFHHDASYQNMRQAMPEVSDSIQEEDSSMLMPHNICQATGQTIEVSSDSVQGKESPVLLHHDACKDMRQIRPELSNPIQRKGSLVLVPYGICQIKGQVVMQVRPAFIQDFAMLMLHGIRQVTGQGMQVSDSTREKKSPLFLHNNQCQVTVQAIQESSDSTQDKESPTLHHNLCQVTEQTMQESSDLTQEKESPLYGAHQVTQQVVQKSSICLKKKASPLLLHNDTRHVIGQAMQKSSDTPKKKEFPLFDNTCRVSEVAKQICYEPPPGNYGYDLLDDWPDEAVFILIDAYKQHEHLLRFEEVTVKQFWNIIASQLAKKNYNPTDFQCRLKMKDLNYTYRIIKNQAKNFNNQTWKFFDVMDKLFNKQSSVVSIITSDSNNPNLSFPKLNIDSDKSCPTSRITVYEPPFKRLKQIGDDNLGHTMQDS